MKICIIAWWYGKNDRGMETLALNLKNRLPYETTILTCHSIRYSTFPLWRTFIKLIHKLKLYRAFYQIEKLIPRFDVFNEDFLDVLSLSGNMHEALDLFSPNLIINLSGNVTSFYLNRYRAKTGVPFISCLVAGKCLTEVKNCRNEPDAYICYTPSHLEYFKQRFPHLRIELIPMGAGS